MEGTRYGAASPRRDDSDDAGGLAAGVIVLTFLRASDPARN
jgi:hypothetical protein